MVRKYWCCDHEYGDTSEWLNSEIGDCCRKCGRPRVKHKHFKYWWRVKKASTKLLMGWSELKYLSYKEFFESLFTAVAFPVMVLLILVTPLFVVFAPILGFIGWVRVNIRLRKEARSCLSQGSDRRRTFICKVRRVRFGR